MRAQHFEEEFAGNLDIGVAGRSKSYLIINNFLYFSEQLAWVSKRHNSIRVEMRYGVVEYMCVCKHYYSFGRETNKNKGLHKNRFFLVTVFSKGENLLLCLRSASR